MGDSELKEIKTSNHWRISCHFREVQNAHLCTVRWRYY